MCVQSLFCIIAFDEGFLGARTKSYLNTGPQYHTTTNYLHTTSLSNLAL